MQEELQKLIARIIENLDASKLDERITSYTDYKSRYVVLRPSVKVDVDLTDGRTFKIDVTDYFEGVAK